MASAFASLNKTITEIMEHLGDDGPRPGGRKARLRPFLRKKIGDLCERRFKQGFNRGHIESDRQFRETGKVPRVLKHECRRNLAPGQEREIILESAIRRTAKKRRSKTKNRTRR